VQQLVVSVAADTRQLEDMSSVVIASPNSVGILEFHLVGKPLSPRQTPVHHLTGRMLALLLKFQFKKRILGHLISNTTAICAWFM